MEYPGLDGVKQMPDLLAKYNPGKKMRNNQAEIALFAVDEEKRLRAIAIQNRATKGTDICVVWLLFVVQKTGVGMMEKTTLDLSMFRGSFLESFLGGV